MKILFIAHWNINKEALGYGINQRSVSCIIYFLRAGFADTQFKVVALSVQASSNSYIIYLGMILVKLKK